MKDVLPTSIRLGLTLAGGALLTALPVDLSVQSKDSLVSLKWQEACAMSVGAALVQNGSCAPRSNWICGLNGQNYPNHYFTTGC